MRLVSGLIFFSVVVVLSAQSIGHPNCDNSFVYIYINEKLGWVGFGFLWTTFAHRRHNTTLDVDFETVALTDSSFLGKIKMLSFFPLKTTSSERRWNVNYEVIFPTQNPLPDVTRIALNGESMCIGAESLSSALKPSLVKLHLEYNDYLKEQTFTAKLIRRRPVPITQTQPTVDIKNSYAPDNLGCGKVDLSNIYVPLVLGGTTIQRGTWPWLVSVYSYSKLRLGFRCGATLISRKLVVTAAHCFFDIYNRQVKTEDVVIILGQYNLKRPQDTGTEIVYPESVNIHPNYRKRNSADSDIAVVKLFEAARFTTYIRPACLWKKEDTKEGIVGQIGYTAGWGQDENGNFYTELPKQVEIPVVSDASCLVSHKDFSKIITEGTFCAGWRNGTEGPCNGDSGGPLVFERNGRWTLRGVVSTSLSTDGSNTCNLNEYIVFTDVAKFRDWILTFSDDSYEF